MTGYFRASLRAIIIIAWVLILLPVTIFCYITKPYSTIPWIGRCFQGILWICGFEIAEKNKPEENFDKPVFYVSNHSSYFDILVLGSCAPMHFTPKREISHWPILGFLTNLSMPIYIDRSARHSLEQNHALNNLMNNNRNIAVFPEATTNDGTHILPFKSTLFAAATTQDTSLCIQPVSIVYSHMDGQPTSAKQRRMIAWYGDDTLIPHLWNILKIRHITATVTYYPLPTTVQASDRKSLCSYCENAIKDGINTQLTHPMPTINLAA